MKTEIITPKSRTTLRDIVKSRYVIEQFAKRDFTIRYKNSYLGYLWAIFNPLFNALIYITIFGFLVRMQTPEYPTSYSVVLLLGLLIWTLFNQAAEQASNVLVNNMHILKKVYFPRLCLCIAATSSAAVDFFIAMVTTIIIFSIYGFSHFQVNWNMLLLPIITLGVVILALSVGTFLAILKVKFQDIKHLVPLVFQVLFFASPIVYTSSIIPKDWLLYYHMNPLYGYINAIRWVFIKNAPFEIFWFIYSLIFSLILFIIAMYYFAINERKVVDSE